MANSQGFWSYVHADDRAEGERISRLARDVAGQFEMLTGERELQFFARRATRLGIKELVLPLLYVDVPSLHDETDTDDLVGLVRTFQWEDWRELRFVDVSAEGYRKGVARLAARLVEANRQLEKSDVTSIARRADESLHGAADDSPGFLDQIATAEETLPKLSATIEAIGQDIEHIGQVLQEATAELKRGDTHAKGFAGRVLVLRKVSRQLSEPAERVWSLGNDFASQLHEVDEGFRVLIERAAEEVKQNPDSKTEVCSFFHAVRALSAAAHAGLNSTQEMIEVIGPIEKMSRDLRPVLRRLRQGLTIMVEAREVSDEWLQLIDASGVVCEGGAIQTT